LSEFEVRQKPRVLDFVSIDGLCRLTGCVKGDFLKFIVKELLDNALDKKDTKNIDIVVSHNNDALTVFVADDGKSKTFTQTDVEKLLDFERAPSSKRAIKGVKRGVLGNALQCCLGISYALWEEDKRPEHTAEILGEKLWKIGLKVENGTIKHRLENVEINNFQKIEYLSNFLELNVKNCITESRLHNVDFHVSELITALTLKLPPDFEYEDPLRTIWVIATVNPHVTIRYLVDGKQRWVSKAIDGVKAPHLESFGDIWWYTFQDFCQLMDEFPSQGVEAFLTNFKHFKNRRYAGKVLEAANIPTRKRLLSLTLEEKRRIFEVLRSNCSSTSPKQLPAVGEESFRKLLGSNIKYSVKRGILEDDEKVVPYLVEALAAPGRGRIFEAVNFTASLYRPFTKWVWEKKSLTDLVKDKDIDVLVHFVCPAITWLSPSKGEMAELNNVKDTLFSVVRSVVKTKLVKIDEGELINLVNEVLTSQPEMDFTVRQIFYQLVAKHGYPNTVSFYKKLIKVLRKARELGYVNAERIVDLSRPEYYNDPSHHSLKEYLSEKLNQLLESFDLSHWDKQPFYVEVWVEKEALSRVILPICRKYRVNLIVGRGYSSYTQIYRAAERFPEDKLAIVLYLGDHDPPGLHIEEKLKTRLKHEAYRQQKIPNITVKRVALTYQQIIQLKLPPSPLKKVGQKRREYLRMYGDKVWELDALDPETLNKLLEEEIQKYIEWKAWKKEEAKIRREKKKLQTILEEVKRKILTI